MQIVLASNNAKKLSELRAFLGDLGVALLSPRDLGLAEADEPHPTFI